MSERLILHPEDYDNNPRADCAIFFSEDHSTSGPHVSLDAEDEDSQIPDYLSIVELKSTYDSSGGVKDQIEGAIDFVIGLLKDCCDPPWDLKCYCIIPHDTGYRRRTQVRFSKQIQGILCVFKAEPVDNGESLRDVVNRDLYSVTI
jgi:hypothetical protein